MGRCHRRVARLVRPAAKVEGEGGGAVLEGEGVVGVSKAKLAGVAPVAAPVALVAGVATVAAAVLTPLGTML